MKELRRQSVILTILIGFKLVQAIYALKTGAGGPYAPWALLLEGVAVALVAKPVIMLKKWALWGVGIYLLILGGGGLFLFFLAPLHQYFLKTIGLVLGGFFLYGALVLLRQARIPDSLSRTRI